MGATDHPSPRKEHNYPIVRMGGIAMISGYMIAIIASTHIFQKYLLYDLSDLKIVYILLFGSLLSFLIGVSDDIFNLSPWPRLSLQIIMASIIWSFNIRIDNIIFTFNSWEIALPIYQSYLITVIWIVGTINAINWIDGIDGLASGVSIIACTGIIIIGGNSVYSSLTYLASGILGSCIGFIPYNYNNNRIKKILMGDGGSYFLGFSISTLCILL